MTDNLKTRIAEATTERELRAVAEACYNTALHHGFLTDEFAKTVIQSSDSKYVKGLVEALKGARESVVIAINYSSLSPDKTRVYNQVAILNNIDETLQNLPEDLR